ncbi:MAG TPA: response regulator transcription factor [Chloroflexota bacterium]|nr:response regulator transcription factor [Chloroflexota bacterium]
MRLLLVDADDAHRHDLGARLRNDGFEVACAAGRAEAVDLASRSWPHLVLTDLSFADGPAERLVQELSRHGDLPFVVVSTNGDAAARVQALDRFADDFVTRPYYYDELAARVRRVLRRALIGARLGEEGVTLGRGRWVDLHRREIRSAEETIRLTPTEARLLGLFLLNTGQVLPMNLILQRVWGDAPAGVNTLWEYVRRLRIKLGDDAQAPRYIVSARGIGYEFKRVIGEEKGSGVRSQISESATRDGCARSLVDPGP